ncbi:transcriptional repressor scratch 2-like [Mobula hypostoma]|uniref:transcriptional repressor scratch 2-like n=1 Tax=Mobula hypostoma TaxID=723540 RepID=UPI002FC2F857
MPLSLLLSPGYIHSYISPSVYENGAERQSGLGTPDPVYTKVNEVYGDPEGLEPDSPQSGLTTGYFSGEAAAVSEGYSMDAFFITDGRSRKRPESVPRERAQRHTCSECGKTYATSSNLSRHKQTHRSLDSKLARKCPTCSKVYVSMPALAMHVLTHDLKHKCETCGKAFRDDRRASISKIHYTKLLWQNLKYLSSLAWVYRCPHQVLLAGKKSSFLGFMDTVFPGWERLWAHMCTCYIYFQFLVLNGD